MPTPINTHLPKSILAALLIYPSAYATKGGLVYKQPNGSIETLVTWPNLDKAPFMASPTLIAEEVAEQSSTAIKQRGRKPSQPEQEKVAPVAVAAPVKGTSVQSIVKPAAKE